MSMGFLEKICVMIEQHLDHLDIDEQTKYKICIDLINRYITKSEIQFSASDCTLFKLAINEMEIVAAGHPNDIKIDSIIDQLEKRTDTIEECFLSELEQDDVDKDYARSLFLTKELFEALADALFDGNIPNIICDISQFDKNEGDTWNAINKMMEENPHYLIDATSYKEAPITWQETWNTIKQWFRIETLRFNLITYTKAPL